MFSLIHVVLLKLLNEFASRVLINCKFNYEFSILLLTKVNTNDKFKELKAIEARKNDCGIQI